MSTTPTPEPKPARVGALGSATHRLMAMPRRVRLHALDAFSKEQGLRLEIDRTTGLLIFVDTEAGEPVAADEAPERVAPDTPAAPAPADRRFSTAPDLAPWQLA